jgi:hypothetical protein
MDLRLFGVALAGACVVQSASAAIVVTTNQALWNSAVAGFGVVATETFNGIANGFYNDPFAGSVTPSAVGAPAVTWSASAAGGLYVQDGVFSTNNPTTLTFTFTPGVRAVAGNFFGTDINFGNATVLFTVELSNGTAYEGISADATTFTGFRSTNAATISSLELTVVNAPGFVGGGDVYPSVDNLYFGVIPAPGAFAILGAAGLVGFSLRRR